MQPAGAMSPHPRMHQGAITTAGGMLVGAGLVISLLLFLGSNERALLAAGAALVVAFTGAALVGLVRHARRQARTMGMLEAKIEDLTDRNWELREAADRSRSLLEAHGDLILRRDGNGQVTYANDAFRQLVGPAASSRGGTALALDVLAQGESRTLADGTRVHDQKIATPSGPRWIAWREVAVRDDVAQPAELQSVGRDVTDRIDAEHALLDARDQAEAASRAKSRFLAMVSHEVRTPLNGILGMTDLMLDTQLTAEQTTYAKAIKRSGDALLSLIEEVLDFSKIEAGKLDIQARPFTLPALIEELIELLSPRAQAKNLELAYLVDERLAVPVVGDATRLRQVLLNLVGNAIKFTEKGGVSVLVEPGAHPDIVCFRVDDTGIGIAPEAQARIFFEFEQADGSAARRYSGTGLGLAISKRLVERMGGTIGVTSEVGRGSRFHFTAQLPRAEEGAACDVQRPDLNGSTILIVSATHVEGPLIAEQLGRWGARTCVVQDAGVAHALIPERAWDAMIIDHGLAGAAELAQASRPEIATRIVLIAPSERHELARLEDDGFTSYLVKPVRPSSLAARLGAGGKGLEPVEASPSPARKTSTRCNEGKGLSILVVEDNEINALLARSLLLKLGHQPSIAVNGVIAIESWGAARAAETPYDIVLMDVHMPEMDGLEATRRIRAAERAGGLARTPVVALTANAFDEDRADCREAGMDAFVTKPLDRERLADVLAQVRPPSPTPVAA